MNSRQILVADDDLSILKILTRILEHDGYSVIATDSGPGFFELCWQFEPCLVFLDMMMPGVDGAEVIRTLNKVMGDATPPVVLVTAVELSEDEVSRIGAVAYVRKPFAAEQILSLAKRYA